MGRIRLGKRIKEFVPLAGLEDIVFGGRDVHADNVFGTSPVWLLFRSKQ